METFSALLAICAGNSPVTVNSPHKGQWHGVLMFLVNNREAGDSRRHRAHYDVIVIRTTEFGGHSGQVVSRDREDKNDFCRERTVL